jgi:O-antigen ligase
MIRWGLGAALVFAPLAFGAVHAWSYGTVWGILWVLVGLWIGRRWWIGARTGGPWEFRWVKAPFQPCMVFFALWILLQCVPLPAVLLGFLQPHAIEPYRTAEPLLGSIPSFLPLSLYPNVTWVGIYHLWSCGAMFFLMLYHLRTETHIRRFAFLWVLLGSFEALYGLSEYLAGTHRIWWWTNPYGVDSVNGTFLNRDHLAGFLEMTIVVGLGILLAMRAQMRKGHHLDWRGRLSRMARDDRWIRAGLLFFLCVLIGSALLLSLSRGGTLALLAVVLPISCLLMVRRTTRRYGIVGLALFVGMVAYTVPLGLDKLLQRFSDMEEGLAVRWEIWATAVAVGQRYPWVGSGLGTFEWVSREFKSERYGEAVLEHAHNDWLELWTEAGWIGLFAVLIGVGLYLAAGLRTWADRRNPWTVCLGFGALAVVVVLGVHSLGEHVLQTQANALTLSAVMAWGWVVLHHHRNHRRDSLRWAHGRFAMPAWWGNLIMGLLAAVHLLLGVGMARHLLAEFLVPTERNSTVARRDVKEPRDLMDAIDLEPGNARRWALLGREILGRNVSASFDDWAQGHGVTTHGAFPGNAGWARALLGKAIRLNPTDADLYEQMAWVLASKPEWRREGLSEQSLRTALTLDPRNGQRYFQLGHYLLLDGRYEGANALFQEAVRLSPALRAPVRNEWAMVEKGRQGRGS